MAAGMTATPAWQSLGLQWPSPAYVFGAIVFSLIGLVALRRGRRLERHLTTALGLALMLFPYAISRTWLLYAVGVALCAGIYFDRG